MSGAGHKQIEAELIERCRRGEERAQRELFKRTLEDVRRILFRLSGPSGDMEDMVQQVFLALFGAVRRFRGESSFSTFLFGICLRVARRQARSSFRWWRLKTRLAGERPEAAPCADGGEGQRARAVKKVLEELPVKHREILVLYEMEELGGREIARILGIPEGTVWTRLHHARRAFRKAWAGGKQV